jgi:hypothetical protein
MAAPEPLHRHALMTKMECALLRTASSLKRGEKRAAGRPLSQAYQQCGKRSLTTSLVHLRPVVPNAPAVWRQGQTFFQAVLDRKGALPPQHGRRHLSWRLDTFRLRSQDI